jgi:hypothetical protein
MRCSERRGDRERIEERNRDSYVRDMASDLLSTPPAKHYTQHA